MKKFKQQYKQNDYPVEVYKEELEKNERARAHIETMLFEDRLDTGLFHIKSAAHQGFLHE